MDVDTHFAQVSYQFDPAGITATLTSTDGNWTVLDGFGGTDTLLEIEAIEGSDFDDVLTGGDGFQRFRPRNGADDIDGGGGSTDEVDYRFSGGDRGVVADLSAGSATDTFGNTDTLANIERLRGSAFDDELTGDSGANRLRGEEGNDVLVGKAGADELIGGDGQDVFKWNSSSEGAETVADGTPTGLGLSVDSISDFVTNFDRLVLDSAGFAGFNAGDTFETGVNFFVIGSEYDGTNAGAADGTARIVVDSVGNVVADGDGATGAGYTVVANVGAGTTVGTEDVQVI